VTLDFTNVDIPMATPLVGTLPLLFTKALTPVQLSTDPMAVGSLDQYPMVQFRSSCAHTPETKLRTSSPVLTADGFFALDLMAQIVSSCAELSCSFDLHRNSVLFLSFLPQMENLTPSWLSSCSSNLLLSLQGVQQPCEDPSVDSSSKFQNSKSSLLLLCLSAQYLNAHQAEYLFTERSTVLSSVHSLLLLNAHLAEFHRTPQRFCLQLCFSYTAFPPEVFNNLKVFTL
jgi:hypothetical protein